jgi:hypothetical protein
MNDAMEALLERLEFQALDVTVRFYGGATSAKEVHAAREQLRRVREIASSHELARSELFAFRRGAEPVRAGH